MGIKVTDKRMFTPDGELREEYRDLADAPVPAPPVPAPPPAEPAASPAAGVSPELPPPAGRVEIPGPPPGTGPTFYDLVGLLAEPIPLYLGDATLPDGQKIENPEMARLHIDLLDVLRRKTLGNLDPQELAVLEDLLARARMRYVQKWG